MNNIERYFIHALKQVIEREERLLFVLIRKNAPEHLIQEAKTFIEAQKHRLDRYEKYK